MWMSGRYAIPGSPLGDEAGEEDPGAKDDPPGNDESQEV